MNNSQIQFSINLNNFGGKLKHTYTSKTYITRWSATSVKIGLTALAALYAIGAVGGITTNNGLATLINLAFDGLFIWFAVCLWRGTRSETVSNVAAIAAPIYLVYSIFYTLINFFAQKAALDDQLELYSGFGVEPAGSGSFMFGLFIGAVISIIMALLLSVLIARTSLDLDPAYGRR